VRCRLNIIDAVNWCYWWINWCSCSKLMLLMQLI